MRRVFLLTGVIIALLTLSLPVATQPWNLPRPVVLNGCSENALIIAIKSCARSSGCARGLANYENVEPQVTVCCEKGHWGLKIKRHPSVCKIYDRIPVKPPEVAPFR